MTEFAARAQKAFGDVLELIATASEIEAALGGLCRITREMARSDVTAIALVDSDMAWHVGAADGNLGELCLHFTARVGEGLIGAAIERCVPMVSEDYAADLASAQFVGTAAAEVLPGERIQAAIAAPLMVRGSALGVLLAGYRQPTAIPLDTRDALGTVARQIAIALDGSRLLDAAREQALYAELLNSMIQKIRSELDAGEVSRIAAATLGRGIGAERCLIFLTSQAGREIAGEYATGATIESDSEMLGAIGGILESDDHHEELELTGGLHSVIATPIQFGGIEAGVLVVTKGPLRTPWTASEKRFVARSAEEIGKAIGHARLFESESAAVARLRELDQIKNEFVSVVSHELRTPLTSIKGFTSTLLENYDEYGTEERMRFLGIIQRQAERLERLITDFLDVSRIQQGALTLELGRVELADVAREAIAENSAQAAGREIVLTGGSALIEGDREKVLQVISNLISNSVKYGAGTITVHITDGDGEAVVVVEDEGKGVSPDQADRIFEKFFQAEQGATRRASGVGLGLAIVKGMVEAHGGRVWYEQADPRGARFCFSLPWVVSDEIRKRSVGSPV